MSKSQESSPERRRETGDGDAVVFVSVEGAERHDPRTWDDMLAAAVRRLRDNLRDGDSVGRYEGGVLALLSGVRSEFGEAVASRLVAALHDVPVDSARGPRRLEASASVEPVGEGESLDDAARRARGG